MNNIAFHTTDPAIVALLRVHRVSTNKIAGASGVHRSTVESAFHPARVGSVKHGTVLAIRQATLQLLINKGWLGTADDLDVCWRELDGPLITPVTTPPAVHATP